jgi:hypothetical protein
VCELEFHANEKALIRVHSRPFAVPFFICVYLRLSAVGVSDSLLDLGRHERGRPGSGQ